jgi:hypothetical protein
MTGRRDRPWLWLADPFVIYGLIVIVLFRFHLYHIGPDAISYISIAGDYAHGRWGEAINSHWSPMFSWLLALVLAAGIPVLPAVKLISAVSGAIALFATIRWTRSFGLGDTVRMAAESVAAVTIASLALLQAGPDLLLAGLFLLYLQRALRAGYDSDPWAGVQCGIIAAVAYFTKAYFFVFFIGHFSFASLLRLAPARPAERRLIIKNLAAGIAAFLLVSAPWIISISRREKRFTISVHGEFSYRVRGPASTGYPQFGRFIPPPSDHSTSMWEAADPSLSPAWHFYDSSEALRHQIGLLREGCKELLLLLQDSSFLAGTLLLGYFLLAASGRGNERYPWVLLLSALAVYPVAYLFVVVVDRYFSGWLLLIMVLGFFVVDAISRSPLLTAPVRRIFVAVVFLSFLVSPVRSLASARNGGSDLYAIARTASRHGGNMASCARWNDSLEIAFYMSMRFFGTTGVNPREIAGNLSGVLPKPSGAFTGTRLDAQLAANHIDYYAVWDDCAGVPGYIRDLPDITGGKAPGIHIYSLSGH